MKKAGRPESEARRWDRGALSAMFPELRIETN